jgi:hypothetical protein
MNDREELVVIARSLFEHGYTFGTAGNASLTDWRQRRHHYDELFVLEPLGGGSGRGRHGWDCGARSEAEQRSALSSGGISGSSGGPCCRASTLLLRYGGFLSGQSEHRQRDAGSLDFYGRAIRAIKELV